MFGFPLETQPLQFVATQLAMQELRELTQFARNPRNREQAAAPTKEKETTSQPAFWGRLLRFRII